LPRVARKKKSQRKQAEETSSESKLPKSFWSGTLSFGLVTIPVELYSATRSTRRSLRMLAHDGTPLARRYYSGDGKALENDDLERGFELDDGSFVVVGDDELERLLPDQSRDIDLTRFVPRTSIPPLYFDKAYILAPAESTHSAYRLLASTMERLDKAGIATFVMRDRQYLVAITSRDGILRAETLRFTDELRTPESVGLPAEQKPSAERVRHMKAAIKNLSKAQVVEKELSDSYWQRLEKLVAKKKAHNENIVPAQDETQSDENVAEVIDLMAVLRQSLANQKAPGKAEKPGNKKTRAAHPEKARARR
jgi:DNA end-binding protein Ku